MIDKNQYKSLSKLIIKNQRINIYKQKMSLNREQEHNKQLTKYLQKVRELQPNHIPVYIMKYKQGSDQIIPQVKKPLGLYSKEQKLQVVRDMIVQQSKEYCLSKYHINFIKQVYLYTIKLLPQRYEQMNNTERLIKQNNKTAKGYFVKLENYTTFDKAFKDYGRQNVLTLVYTDKSNVKMNYGPNQEETSIKWLVRLLIFIIILIIVPFVLNSSSQTSSTHIQQNSFNSNTVQRDDINVNSKKYQKDQYNEDYQRQNSKWNKQENRNPVRGQQFL